MTSRTQLSVTELRQGLLAGDFSAVELTESHLERIRETNDTFNSFITVADNQALEQAQNADALFARHGEMAPPLAGIPVAIKDLIVTKNLETTCASKILRGFNPPYDATVVAKLKAQGAIVVGKTNCDEFGMGSSNENSSFGPVKNPWNHKKVSGGSSGGSAAAVSLGCAPIALGTDTGGSIRQPAAFCGVVGLKPTYGRVSRYGAVAFASSLDQIGPMARSVGDLALSLQAISGYDRRDSTSMQQSVPDYAAELRQNETKGLEGLRIGAPIEYFPDDLNSDVAHHTRQALERLRALGAEIIEISLPHTSYAISTYYILAPAEASSNLARYDGVRYGFRHPDASSLADMYEKTRAEGFGPEVKRRILIGSYVLSAGYYEAYYGKAQQVRTLVIKDFTRAFEHCDIIATPVTPTTAFGIGEKLSRPLDMYLGDAFTIPASLAGLPGLSLPIGLADDGLPIGIQLIGPPFSESRLLFSARALERETAFEVFGYE